MIISSLIYFPIMYIFTTKYQISSNSRVINMKRYFNRDNIYEKKITNRRVSFSLAPFLKICHRNDPNLNECVKRSIDLLRPYLKAGVPAFQIPPCEPLRVPRIEISQSSGPVSIRSTFTDIEVQGGTSFILKSVKYVKSGQIKRRVKFHP